MTSSATSEMGGIDAGTPADIRAAWVSSSKRLGATVWYGISVVALIVGKKDLGPDGA